MRVFVQAVSLAQLVEQLTLNQWVESSSLSGDTKDICGCLFLCPRAQTSRVLISLCSNDYCVHTISEPLGGHKREKGHPFGCPFSLVSDLMDSLFEQVPLAQRGVFYLHTVVTDGVRAVAQQLGYLGAAGDS